MILSTYNKAADLNEKYLREINDSKRVITSLEQKISKVEEERDSSQLVTSRGGSRQKSDCGILEGLRVFRGVRGYSAPENF